MRVEVLAGRLDDHELAGLVVVLSRRAHDDPPRPLTPAWRRAALAERAGAVPLASPADLRGLGLTGR